MRGIPNSVRSLLIGVMRRFKYWLPLLLLDSTDYWERYIQPGLLRFTGRDVAMPPDALVVGAVVGVLWSAFLTYHELLTGKQKLEDKLSPSVEIEPTPVLQNIEKRMVGVGPQLCRLFFITIRNPSAQQLRDVGVYLTHISPLVDGFDWLPIPLHIKHDNSQPHRETFNVNPYGVRHIDLVSRAAIERVIKIEHAVGGVSVEIPDGVYVLTVRAEGGTLPLPRDAKFLIKIDQTGRLICIPAAYSDLHKGFLDFQKDANRAMKSVNKSMDRLTSITNKIGEILSDCTRIINNATSTPISWWEVVIGIRTIQDRIRGKSPRIGMRIDRATYKLEKETIILREEYGNLMNNCAGLVETGPEIPAEDITGLKNLRAAGIQALDSIRSWRESVGSVERMRISTHIIKAMQSLGRTLDDQVRTIETTTEALGDIIRMAEDKRRPRD